jgi:DNA helicase-2/ATP-dependent DNA helicase PcrA
MDFLEGLNPQQREAVCHTNGPLLILAGAGSGKTRVITHRIARLIAVEGVSPDSILAVTFTNKAAAEMRGRVAQLVCSRGISASPWLSTFHSFCVRMLRRDGAPLANLRNAFTPQFAIYDEDEQAGVVKSAYRRLGLDESFMPYRAALGKISNAKNQKQSPAEFYKLSTDPKASRLAVVYEEYENYLRQANALDFDDLLLEAVRLLQHDEEVREAYNRRFRYLMIDEYQDTNRSQYELMRLLTVGSQNICVVGDEDQSIYGWRGADIRNILDFEHDYPDARVIRLEQNYRSTRPILEAASALVSHNTQRKGKWLWTEEAKGRPIGLFEACDGEQEALFIAAEIGDIRREGETGRIAILYRTNAQSRQIEEALRRHAIKYHVVGGFSFYQRAEIRDALAYLKVLVSPEDSVSLSRIINTPARGIGRTTLEQIERYANQHRISLWAAIGRMSGEGLFSARAQAALAGFRKFIEDCLSDFPVRPLHDALRRVLEKSGYWRMLEEDSAADASTRLENLQELLNAASEAVERGETAVDFLDHAALVSDSDQLDESADVSLLTLHNAKGLEFPIVFVAGLEEGLCPHSRSAQSEAMIEEERRLCYVGMTRAERRLILTWARSRRRFGGGSLEPIQPSRFLSEIPAKLTEQLGRLNGIPEIDLFLDQHEVREIVTRTAYTGKTYNSVEHIRQFFAGREGNRTARPAVSVTGPADGAKAPSRPVAAQPATVKSKKGTAAGAVVVHPVYGRGTVVRREGDGDDAKLTVMFPRHGLKKLVQKFAGLKIDE